MQDVVIAPQSEGKGRAFHAILLASIEADGLWFGGSTGDDQRPVWAMFANSDQELRAFMANMILGKKANLVKRGGYSKKSDRVELLKSAGYQCTWQREEEGSIATVFLPDLFRLDPGMVDKDGAKFVCLPTVDWVQDQKIDSAPIMKHILKFKYEIESELLASWIPLSFLFCTYLDRRTRCPLLSDPRFYLQILLAFLQQGSASWPTNSESYYRSRDFGYNWRFIQQGTDQVGLSQGVAFNAGHDTIERVLAEQVSLFFQATKGR